MAGGFRGLVYNQVDLKDFLETTCGVRLRKTGDDSYKTLCPFPYHRDGKPSFQVDLKEGGWMWYCYGCSEGGTIFEFVQKYFSLDAENAVKYITDNFEIRSDVEAIVSSMALSGSDSKRRVETETHHVVLCNVCYDLLKNRSGDKEVFLKVKNIFSRANEALSTMDANEMYEIMSDALSID
jgi:DNA primase